MSTDTLILNGIDGSNGGYLLPPMPVSLISEIARREKLDPDQLKELRGWYQRAQQAPLAPIEGVDTRKLEQTGWGVIFPAGLNQRVLAALREDTRPTLMLWADADPVLPVKTGERFAEAIGREAPEIVEGAGHFLQEDAGERIGERIAAWLRG